MSLINCPGFGKRLHCDSRIDPDHKIRCTQCERDRRAAEGRERADKIPSRPPEAYGRNRQRAEGRLP